MKDNTKILIFIVIMLILLAISMYFTIIEYQKEEGSYNNEYDLYKKDLDLYRASPTGKILPTEPSFSTRGKGLFAALIVEGIVILLFLGG